jgi:hypothetical protein
MVRAVSSLVLVWTCASAAVAQPVVTEGYDYWITIAVEAFERGELERAREAFDRAHRAEPSARTWRGLGTVDFRAGRFPEAFVELEAALREERRPLPADLRAAVAALIEQVRLRVAVYEIVGAPPGARIVVDSAEPARDARGRLVLSTGRHLLRLEATGYETATVELDPASGGAVERVHVALRSARPFEPTIQLATAPEPRPVVAAVPSPVVTLGAVAEAPHPRTWTWVAAAGVPLFVAAAGLSWARADDVGDGIAARCDRDRCSSSERTARIDESPLATFETLTNVAWALAGASLFATGIAFVVERDAAAGQTQLSVIPAGVSLTRSF